MNIKVYPSKLNGSLPAVSSKSDVHRALICAAFSNAPTDISCNLLSRDIEATMRCLNAAGAGISWKEKEGMLHVEPIAGNASKKRPKEQKFQEEFQASCQEGGSLLEKRLSDEALPELFCGESGSTLRFLLPVMAAFGLNCRFTGAGELPNRPLSELVSVLRTHGARISEVHLPLTLGETWTEKENGFEQPSSFSKAQKQKCAETGEGKRDGGLSGGEFQLPGNISSQYITGLLLSFPLLRENARIRLSSALQSSAYVDMTLATMRRFGVTAACLPDGYLVEPKSSGSAFPYLSPGSYQSDGDWSNAAFWLIADQFPGNKICVKGLREDSLQGDRKIAELVKASGRELTIDASGIPDLVPALSALFALRDGCTARIVHAERLRLKECDRLRATAKLLLSAGADIEELPDGLIIRGKESLFGGAVVSGENDHRIVMTAAILATACRKPLLIQGAEAVEKSYPHFFQDLRKLGGRWEAA